MHYVTLHSAIVRGTDGNSPHPLLSNSTAQLLLPCTLHDGSDFHLGDRRVLPDRARICVGVHAPMSPWELIMGSIMAVALTAYLVYAMLRPEKL
jgi:K+-transporting ATPase KdpF subunit